MRVRRMIPLAAMTLSLKKWLTNRKRRQKKKKMTQSSTGSKQKAHC
jgi:hypothetical protein